MPPTRRTALLAAAATIAALAVMIAPLLLFGTDQDTWRYSARYTARFSFGLLLIVLVSPARQQRFDAAPTRDAFLAFAAAHIVHLGALATYRYFSNQPPDALAIAVGGTAYGLLAAFALGMLFGRPPGRALPYLLHYLVIVAAITYAMRLPEPETRLIGIVGLAACATALALRHLPWHRYS
jgi:hypothetical protein